MASSPVAKRVLFALLPSLVLLVVALIVAEIGLRVRFDRIEAITGVAEWQTGEFMGITYHWDQYDPVYGWTNVPNYRSGPSAPFRLRINGQGLRAPREYDAEPPEGAGRVAVFGNSCTFGEEVDDDETIPHHLEQMLEGVEVLNFGVHGWGLGQMVQRIEREAFSYRPDHIVLILMTNNYQRDPEPFFVHAKPAFRVVDGKLRVENVPVPEASRQPWVLRNSFTAAWLFGRPAGTPRGKAGVDEALEVTSLLLRRLADACRSHDVPLTIFHITVGPLIRQMHDSVERYQLQAVRRVLDESGIPTIDLTGFLAEKRRTVGPSLEKPAGHWSGAGNRLIAEKIAGHLAERYPEWAR